MGSVRDFIWETADPFMQLERLFLYPFPFLF